MARRARLPIACLFALLGVATPLAAAEDGDPPTPSPPLPVVPVGEVVATTTRSERANLETPGNITVLEREDIEESGARDVPDLLRREAGIWVTNDSTNPEGYRVEARGFENGGGNGQGTLVLIDGVRVTEAASSRPDWALLRLANIERIEVVRGPVNAAWGDNAEAGVINITTRSAEGSPVFESRGRFGSWDTYGGSIFAGGSDGPVRASLFVDRLHTDAYRDRASFKDHGGVLKLGFDFGDVARFDLKTGYTSDRRERPGTLSRAQMYDLGRRAAEPSSRANFQNTRVRLADGTLEVFPLEDVTFKAVTWYRSRTDDGAVSSATSDFESTTEAESVGLNAQLQFDQPLFGRRNRLVAGGDLLWEDADFASTFEFFPFPASESRQEADRDLWGVFLNDDLNVTEDVILSAGLRYDRDNRDGRGFSEGLDTEHSAWSPRVAVTWRALETASLYVSWARGFRFPNLDETFAVFGVDPRLDTERSETFEVGGKLRRGRLEANLALYHMEVEDEIYFDAEADLPLGRNVNLDRVRHRGIEISSFFRPRGWLELYGSYTFDDVEIREDSISALDGKRMTMVPRHRGTAGARFFLPYDVELGVNGNFVGDRPYLNDIANRFDDRASYAIADAHMAWRPQIGEHLRLALEGNVYNLFDKRYSEVAGIRTDFFSAAREKRFFPSPGRNYELRVMLELRP